MPRLRSFVFPGTYRDSVFLMKLATQTKAACGAEQVSVMMGSERNKELLEQSGMLSEASRKAGPEDLIISLLAPKGQHELLDTAEEMVRALLASSSLLAAGQVSFGENRPASLDEALYQQPHSTMAFISVAGEYARYEAAHALSSGLDVFLYSDNISLPDEVALKKLAAAKGCLLMGPGCGGAIVREVPLGFVNSVRRGYIGLISSSGTGMQEVACLIDRLGLGISQAYGTGGRDMLDAVGAVTTLEALERLEHDEGTGAIVLVATRPGPAVRQLLAERFASIQKPLIVRYMGSESEELAHLPHVRRAKDLSEAARLAAISIAPMLDTSELENPMPGPAEAQSFIKDGKKTSPAAKKFVRGLFVGNALCHEALEIMRPFLHGQLCSNVPLDGVLPIKGYELPEAHSFLDMGADVFTLGRPHPLIAPEAKFERLGDELARTSTGLVFTDIVLGHGTAPNQAALLIQAVDRAAQQSRGHSRAKPVVVSVCATEHDSPSRSSQIALLEEAGVLVCASNAHAARFAATLAAEVCGSKARNKV